MKERDKQFRCTGVNTGPLSATYAQQKTNAVATSRLQGPLELTGLTVC